MAGTYETAVQALYAGYFGRPADPAGLAYWTAVVAAAHGDTTAVAAAFAGSGEYTGLHAGDDAYHLVDMLYLNLFGHEPDVPGLAYWGGALAQGRLTVDQAATAIAAGAQGTDLHVLDNKIAAATAFTQAADAASNLLGAGAFYRMTDDFLQGVTDDASLARATTPIALDTAVAGAFGIPGPYAIEQLYVAALGRPADPASLRYWETVVEADHGSTAAVAAALVQSDEFKALYAQADASGFVDAIYQNVAGRDPQAGELARWAGALADGSLTAGQAVAGITAAVAGARATDAIVLNDKVAVALAFTAALDTPAEIQAYQGDAADAIGRHFLAQVKDAASYLAAIDPAALAHAIDSLPVTTVGTTTPHA